VCRFLVVVYSRLSLFYRGGTGGGRTSEEEEYSLTLEEACHGKFLIKLSLSISLSLSLSPSL
jgi:hypothetical protein